MASIKFISDYQRVQQKDLVVRRKLIRDRKSCATGDNPRIRFMLQGKETEARAPPENPEIKSLLGAIEILVLTSFKWPARHLCCMRGPFLNCLIPPKCIDIFLQANYTV